MLLIDLENTPRFWHVLKQLELAGPDADRSHLARASGEATAVWVAGAVENAITLPNIVHGRDLTAAEIAERTDKLASKSVVRFLPATERERIAVLLETRSLATSRTMIRDGESNDLLYILETGGVRICWQSDFDDDDASA